MAFLPFGDYRPEVTPEPFRLEREPNPPGNHEGADEAIRAIWHYKAAHYDPRDFVMGVYTPPPWLTLAVLGGLSQSPDVVSRRVWPAALNSVSSGYIGGTRILAHEVGHTLSLLHPPACANNTLTPHWPDGIAYWDDAPGPIRQWLLGDWTDPGDGRFNIPRTSESDTRTEAGVDMMGYCRGGEWAISDWSYQTAVLYRMAAEGRLDLPADEATAIRVGGAQSVGPAAQPAAAEAALAESGPSVVVTGSVDATGGWSVAHVDHSERPPTQGTGAYRLSAFGPDGAQVGEVAFDPAPVSHSDTLVWSVRVGYGGETPVRLTVVGPDGSTILDWVESAL